MNFSALIKNKSVMYILSRYLTYFIQFINTLLIAVYLGPYYLGIWGFVQLVIQYFAQINLGLPNSVNVIASINKDNNDYIKKIVGNSLLLTLFYSFWFIILFAVGGKSFDIGSKYNFSAYAPFVFVIALLTYINNIYSNLFRVYGRITSIAVFQSLYVLLVFVSLPFFRGESLLLIMLVLNIVSYLISFIIFVFTSPIKPNFKIDWRILKEIQTKGWFLFLYNASFYLILLSTKTVISKAYEVRDFGQFTFSFSLANAILLLFNAIAFLAFPKLINTFAVSDLTRIRSILEKIKTSYVLPSHLLVHTIILFSPAILFFFPEYASAKKSLILIALTLVLQTNALGYSTLLMAKGKERVLSFIALFILILNIALCNVAVYLLNVNFDNVIIATLCSYLVYIFALAIGTNSIWKDKIVLGKILKGAFPLNLFVPFALSLTGCLFFMDHIFFVLPLLLCFWLNRQEIKKLGNLLKEVILNKNFFNI